MEQGRMMCAQNRKHELLDFKSFQRFRVVALRRHSSSRRRLLMKNQLSSSLVLWVVRPVQNTIQ